MAEWLQTRKIFFNVEDVPGEAHQMFRPRTSFGENGGNISQRLLDLCDKAVRQLAPAVPADHAAGQHEPPVGGHSIGVSLRSGPTARLQYLDPARVLLRRRQCGHNGRCWHAHRSPPSYEFMSRAPRGGAACAI